MRCHSAASRKAAKGDLVGVDWQAVIFTRLVVRLTWIYKPPPPNKFVHLNHLLKSCHTARTLRLSQKASLLLRPCVWGCCWRLKWCRAVCFEVSAHVTTSPQTWGHIIPWISYILGSVRMSLGGAKQGPKHQRPINLPIRIQQGSNGGLISGQRGATSRAQLRASCLPNTFEISFYRDRRRV